MTVGCRDADFIPKVPGAGDVFTNEQGLPIQRMHNGSLVVAGGYHGDWMIEIIRRLKGHHQPQEEALFHQVLPVIAPPDSTPVMIELGASWSYYSPWFRSFYANARNILVEPDPGNLELGRTNFALNGLNAEFVESASGASDSLIELLCESDNVVRRVQTISVDDLVQRFALECIDLLHADVQGAELAMLNGALSTIRQGRLRWLFLSTHHHTVSGDPITHQRCLDWLRVHQAFIVEEHSASESFSGDGLIAAAFVDEPCLDHRPMSRNRSSESLFRETEYDLSDAWNELRSLKEQTVA